MSSTRCEKCNGWGTICKRCGRPRRRKLSKWYSSNGCGCYRARLERCPEHKPSTWSCDICGVTKVGTEHGQFGFIGDLGVCQSCKSIAEAAESVAVEQVLERRTGVANVAEAGEHLVVERLRAEAAWWREWFLRLNQLGWPLLLEDVDQRAAADLRREGYERARLKLEDIETGFAKASGTAPASPVVHARETGGEAVPGRGGVPGGPAAP